MSLKDRTLCRMLKKTLAGKELSQLEPWQQALMEAGDEGHDWTDSKELVPPAEISEGAGRRRCG